MRDIRKFQSSCNSSFSRTSFRLPFGQYSVRQRTTGLSMHAPTKRTVFSWVTSRTCTAKIKNQCSPKTTLTHAGNPFIKAKPGRLKIFRQKGGRNIYTFKRWKKTELQLQLDSSDKNYKIRTHFALEQIIKAQKESRCLALLFL